VGRERECHKGELGGTIAGKAWLAYQEGIAARMEENLGEKVVGSKKMERKGHLCYGEGRSRAGGVNG